MEGLIFFKKIPQHSKLKIQHNPYQNSNDTYYTNRKKNPRIYVETQKSVNSPGDLEKKCQSWMYNTTKFQNILQNYSNQNSMGMEFPGHSVG